MGPICRLHRPCLKPRGRGRGIGRPVELTADDMLAEFVAAAAPSPTRAHSFREDDSGADACLGEASGAPAAGGDATALGSVSGCGDEAEGSRPVSLAGDEEQRDEAERDEEQRRRNVRDEALQRGLRLGPGLLERL